MVCFEDSSDMGSLLVAKVEAHFLQGGAGEDSTPGFFHAMVGQPGGEGGLLMFPEMPLHCPEADAAELCDRPRFVLAAAGEVAPGDLRSGVVVCNQNGRASLIC